MNFKRAYKNFLHVIERLTSVFAEIYNAIIDVIASTTNYKTQFFIVIEKFRHNIRLKETRKKKASAFNLAFVADENKKAINSKTTSLSRAETSYFEMILNQYLHAFAIKSINTLIVRI